MPACVCSVCSVWRGKCAGSLLRVGRSLGASQIHDIGLWGMSLLVTDLHDEIPKMHTKQRIIMYTIIQKVLQFDPQGDL